MEIDNPTEATMQAATISDAATPRYGYDPQVMFAATRAGAERRARETAAAATEATAQGDGRSSSPISRVIRRLTDRLARSGA